jgi:hypothetical protein
MSKLEDDPVNSPSHYIRNGVECIDMIQAMLTPEEFIGYCKGNSIKYQWRCEDKGKTIQDIEKAQWYLDRLKRAVAIRENVGAFAKAVEALNEEAEEDGWRTAYPPIWRKF